MKKLIILSIFIIVSLAAGAQAWFIDGFGGMNRTSPTALFVDSIGIYGVDTVLWIGGEIAFKSSAGGGVHGGTHVSGQTDPIPVFTPTATGLVPASGGGTDNFLRADGTWWSPVTISAHDMLSATHTDAATTTISRGDIITGQTATPQWDALNLSVDVSNTLRTDGTDIIWDDLDFADLGVTPTTIVDYGISDTKANFDAAVSDGSIAWDGGAHHDGFSDFVTLEHERWDLTGTADIHIDRITSSAITQHEANINHANLIGGHNLTTDINHNLILNNHNLTTDIDLTTLTNYDANKYVDHTAVTFSTGTTSGLAGGGDISGNRDFALNLSRLTNQTTMEDTYYLGVYAGANGQRRIAYSDFRAELELDLPPATTFLGLSDSPSSYAGSADYLVTVNSTPNEVEFTNPTTYDLTNFNDNLSGDKHIDHTTIAINTQHSLTGGGNIASTRTLNLVNDEVSPGNSKYYGTGNTGIRGWETQHAPNVWNVVSDFGADPFGIANSYAAFQEALDSAQLTGWKIVIPPGHYIINSPLTADGFNQDRACIIEGAGHVLLDFSGMNSENIAFELECLPGADEDIIADLAIGDTIVKTDLTNVDNGDVLEILSTDSWAITPGIYKRELVIVRRVSNDTIFLYTPLFDSYDESTTIIRRTNAGVLQLRNFKMKGDSSYFQNAITGRYFKDIHISNVQLTDFNHIGFALYTSIGGKIENVSVDGTLRDGFGYGVTLQVVQNLTIQDSRIYGARHAIEMGLTTRMVMVKDNWVYAGAEYKYPLDNHESCEYVTFQGNYVYGGLYMRGLNSNVLNNVFYINNAGPSPIHLNIYGYAPRKAKYHNIIGNTVVNTGDIGSYAIRVQFWDNNDTIEKLVIANNNMSTDAHAIYTSVYDNVDKGNYIGDLIISDNIIENTNPARSAIYLNDSITFKNVLINGNLFRSEGSGIAITGHQNSEKLIIDGATVLSSGYPLSISSGSFDDIIVRNSFLKGEDYNNIDAQEDVVFVDNGLEGLDNGGLIVGSKVNNLYYSDITWKDVTGSITNNAANSYVGVVYNDELQTTIDHDKLTNTHDTLRVFNVLAFGADPTGVVDATSAIQATIDAAIGAGTSDPGAGFAARYPSGAVYMPAGDYRITDSLKIISVVGFRMFGDGGTTKLIADLTSGNLECVLNISGSNMGIFENFSIQGNGSNILNKAIYLHQGDETLIGNQSNSFIKVNVTDCVFHTAFAIGTDNTLDNSSTSFHECSVTGSWLDGNSTTYQNGFVFGNGTAGNTLVNTVYGPRIYGVSRGISFLGTGISVYSANMAENGTDFYYSNPASYPVRIVGVRSEGSGMLFDCSGAQNTTGNTLLESVNFQTDSLNDDGVWLHYGSGGALSLRNILLDYASTGGSPYNPPLIELHATKGSERWVVTLDNVSTPSHIDSLFSTTGNMGNVSVDIRNYSRVNSSNNTTVSPTSNVKMATPNQVEPFIDVKSINYVGAFGGWAIGNTKWQLTSKGIPIPTPDTLGTIIAATGITSDDFAEIVVYDQPSSINITKNPQIEDGADGQPITFVGTSDANTLTLEDGNGLSLTDGRPCVLGLNDNITLKYISASDLWIEQSRSNDNNGVFNVKDYGATGNGSDDDITAINTALTAADGKTLYFPAGTYVISEDITASVDNVTIRGDGPQASIIYLESGANDVMMTVGGDGWIIEDIGFDGNDAGNTGTCHGIYSSADSALTIRNCEIWEVEDNAISTTGTGKRITIHDNKIMTSNVGFFADNGSEYMIKDNWFVACTTPISISNANVIRAMVTGNNWYGCTNDATTASATGLLITDNVDKSGVWFTTDDK